MDPIPPDRPHFRGFSVVQCPRCSTENPSHGSACSTCGKVLTIDIGPPRKSGNFNLVSIMRAIAVISVGLGLLRTFIPLGVLYFVLIPPPLYRTLYVYRRERAWGTPLSWLEFPARFISTALLFMLLYLLVGLVWMTGNAVLGIAVLDLASLLVSAVPAILVGVWLARLFFPR